MRDYQEHAAHRGYEWKLSESEFYGLVTMPCHYSGARPAKVIRTQEGDFLWNGIDRVDNRIGYIPGNVVSCSEFANFAKRGKAYWEFIAWCKQMAEYWGKRDSPPKIMTQEDLDKLEVLVAAQAAEMQADIDDFQGAQAPPPTEHQVLMDRLLADSFDRSSIRVSPRVGYKA